MNGIFSYIDKLTTGSPDVPAKAHEAKATAQVKFQQRKEQAGLLCTSELEVAVARCRRKVDAIIKDCRLVGPSYNAILYIIDNQLSSTEPVILGSAISSLTWKVTENVVCMA
jgi:hypothetical protein